jgi:hypothetical protein
VVLGEMVVAVLRQQQALGEQAEAQSQQVLAGAQ